MPRSDPLLKASPLFAAQCVVEWIKRSRKNEPTLDWWEYPHLLLTAFENTLMEIWMNEVTLRGTQISQECGLKRNELSIIDYLRLDSQNLWQSTRNFRKKTSKKNCLGGMITHYHHTIINDMVSYYALLFILLHHLMTHGQASVGSPCATLNSSVPNIAKPENHTDLGGIQQKKLTPVG